MISKIAQLTGSIAFEKQAGAAWRTAKNLPKVYARIKGIVPKKLTFMQNGVKKTIDEITPGLAGKPRISMLGDVSKGLGNRNPLGGLSKLYDGLKWHKATQSTRNPRLLFRGHNPAAWDIPDLNLRGQNAFHELHGTPNLATAANGGYSAGRYAQDIGHGNSLVSVWKGKPNQRFFPADKLNISPTGWTGNTTTELAGKLKNSQKRWDSTYRRVIRKLQETSGLDRFGINLDAEYINDFPTDYRPSMHDLKRMMYETSLLSNKPVGWAASDGKRYAMLPENVARTLI
jgi:hypothetical protein